MEILVKVKNRIKIEEQLMSSFSGTRPGHERQRRKMVKIHEITWMHMHNVLGTKANSVANFHVAGFTVYIL